MIRRALTSLRRMWAGTTVESDRYHETCHDGCPIHGSASEPAEPAVESLPRQRGILLPVAAIPEAELHAMARVLVGEADDQDRALVSDYCRFVGLMQEVEE